MQGLPVAAASLRWCRLMRHQARGAKTSMAQTAFEPWTGPVMTADWQPRQAKPAQVLTHGQQGAVDAALRGENVFVGGGVGTGKTETLLHVKQALVRKFKSDEGIALLTAGTVVNPALGGFESSLRLVGNLPGVNENPAYAAEGEPSRLANAMAARADFWARLKVLIVDDVETADYDVWRSLRVVLTSLRRLAADPKKQFGEVQVIAAGDFCAVDQGAQATQHSNNYAFEDPEWSNTFTANFELEGTDGGSFAHEKQWARVLKDARFGIFSDELYSSLQARQVSAADPDSGLGIVESPPPATRSESGDTASNVHAYADPLAGRRFVDFDGTAPERDDAYIFRSRAQARHTGYAASSLKSLFVPPSKYTVYKVHITVPTNDEYTGVPAGDETRATMMMRGNIAKMCAGLGPQGPRPNTDFFTSVSVQIFMLGEEVEASMPFHGVLAGQRGVVTELGQEHLTVSFKVNGHSKEVTVHRVLFESSVQIGGRVTPVTTDPAAKASWHVVKPAGDSRIVKTRLWFFPIAHVKMEKPEYYYRAPVLQGSQPGADMPSVLIDFQGLRRLGSNRALYAALALAPSLDKVVVRAETLPILSVFHKTPRTYLAAVLFHNRLSKNLQNLPCAVCGQLLSGPCPMEDRDPAVKECPSLWERYRHCAGNYRRCDVDEVVMTRMEYMAQTKETALVRCECGTVVRFRDLKAHRAQYVVGISCAGPRKKKSSKSA